MEQDRLSYSFGVKMNIGNYQSVDFHISYSSDVKEGETPDKALTRIKKYVEAKVEQEVEIAQREFMNKEF
jgi:hypothetical protein